MEPKNYQDTIKSDYDAAAEACLSFPPLKANEEKIVVMPAYKNMGDKKRMYRYYGNGCNKLVFFVEHRGATVEWGMLTGMYIPECPSERPMGTEVWFHFNHPIRSVYCYESDSCRVTGGKCYCERTGISFGDEVMMPIFRTKGSAGIFKKLRELVEEFKKEHPQCSEEELKKLREENE